MITAITPGTNNPCMNRQKISSCRLREVATSIVGTVSAYREGTMTFLRPMDSAIIPTNGAAMATARMVALTVRLTSISEAWYRCCRYGSSGCVQYTFRKVHMPASMQATMAPRGGGTAASRPEAEFCAARSIERSGEAFQGQNTSPLTGAEFN